MNTKTLIGLIAMALVLLIVSSSLYIIDERERAVMLRFGAIEKADLKPGIGFKVPFMNSLRRFDGRILTLDSPPERIFTIEKKALMVDSFAKWRIKNVDIFYQATSGDEATAIRLLSQRVNEGLRNQFGGRSLQEVVSGQRDELMADLISGLNDIVQQEIGVELIDVRVKKIDLPDEVSDSVYRRMTSEREKEARDYRAKGQEQAEVIRADADRQKAVLEAEAYRESELIRGEGDAEAAAIYADAYNDDPDFYAFVRSLNAYKTAFKGKEDMLLVDPKSDFFRFLNDSKGKAR
ncbi:MAG: protease modulator HflC [Cellvibrionaceae bacterium]|nr:protease modulator HflC [Cellvibrionaceae bacterium]